MANTYRILCAVDGSRGSEVALDLVAALPLRKDDEIIVASRPSYLFVTRPGDGGPMARLASDARARAHAHVDAAIARLAARRVRATSVICDAGDDTVDALLRCVDEIAPSILVVGSRGRGPWSSILLGSTARALAIMSPVPVLIAKTARPPIRVLAAVDGSASSRAALSSFAGLPQSEGCIVELFQVLPVHEWPDAPIGDPLWEQMGRRIDVEMDERDEGLDMLKRARGLLPPGIEASVHQERGHPGLLIVARASAVDADLVVVGTQGLEGRRQPFFGSTAERVLTQASSNVLVARASAVPD